MRRQNRSVDFIFGQFLIFSGVRAPPDAAAKAIKWRKTLIFPGENNYYTEDGYCFSIHNGTGDGFKGLLKVWHETVKPKRKKLLEYAREASTLHVAIAKSKSDGNIDGFFGDINKLKKLR